MKKIILGLLFLPAIVNANPSFSKDGLNLTCRDKDASAEPYNVFDFSLGFNDLEADDSNAENAVSPLRATQFPTFDSNIESTPQNIKGCDSSSLTMNFNNETGGFILNFECSNKTVSAKINMNSQNGRMDGEIYFLKPQSELPFPLTEDTQISVFCDFKYR